MTNLDQLLNVPYSALAKRCTPGARRAQSLHTCTRTQEMWLGVPGVPGESKCCAVPHYVLLQLFCTEYHTTPTVDCVKQVKYGRSWGEYVDQFFRLFQKFTSIVAVNC